MPTNDIDICEKVLTQLRRIVRAMDVHSRQLQRQHALTAPQLVLLREIARHEQIAIGTLAEKVSLSNATVTGVVDRLEQRGLVARLRNGKDRRQVLLSATDGGQRMLEEAPALFQEQFIVALGALQQWEQAQILASLSHLAAMMTTVAPETLKTETDGVSASDGFLASCQMLLESESPKEKEPGRIEQPVTITKIGAEYELPEGMTPDFLAQFLHEHLHPYEDTVEDIGKGLDHALSKRGFVLLAQCGGRLAGALVMLDTGMSGYVPEHLLLFVAVDGVLRGRGVGAQLIRAAQEQCAGSIKLHVEYSNPARRLYERMGFTSKYAEMRWVHESSDNQS